MCHQSLKCSGLFWSRKKTHGETGKTAQVSAVSCSFVNLCVSIFKLFDVSFFLLDPKAFLFDSNVLQADNDTADYLS